MTDIDFNVYVDDRGVVLAGSRSGPKIRGNLKIDKVKVEDLLRRVTDRKQNTDEILEELGKELFNSLFVNEKYSPEDPNTIRDEFMYYYRNAREGRDYLKIILQLDDSYAQSLPWELLHDGQFYLGPQNGVSIVRLPLGVNQETETIKIEDKLNILVVLSNPKGTQELASAKQEKDEIERVFKTKLGENKVRIDVLSTEEEDEDKKPTINNIIDRINETSYHIIHYIGHSSFEGERGQIHLSDNLGDVIFHKDSQFSGIFRADRTTKLGLILLNSCQSGIERGFHGLARQLIARGIPCVVAMQFRILDRVGPDLAREFYESFIDDHAYSPERAIDRSRSKIYNVIAGPNSREFAALVLYLVSTKGKKIFVDSKIGEETLLPEEKAPPEPGSRIGEETLPAKKKRGLPILKQLKELIELHDKKLIMNRMDIVEFCEDEDKGLIPVLIALDANADDIELDYEYKEMIQDMLQEVPTRINKLKRIGLSRTQKEQAELELKQIITSFIRKSRKSIHNR